MERRQTPPSRPPNPALPYREDCWSEGETSVLIDAWGDRYVELNRGNLRQKQWQEVADAVNSRPCDARRPPRTDVQCKNRIDTLKKKYKVEKSKIVDCGGALASQWIFYNRLDVLIGTAAVPPKKQAPPLASSPPMALPLPPSHRKGYPLPTASAVRPIETTDWKRQTAIVPVMEDSYYRRSYLPPPAAAAVAAESEDESDSDSSRSSGLYRKRPRAISKERSVKGLRKGKEGGGDEDGIRELSRAIVRMAEIYERVEVEKQRQMMELEKQRMEFAKSLEFQRMQMFVDSQVQLMKRGKRSDPGQQGAFNLKHGNKFIANWCFHWDLTHIKVMISPNQTIMPKKLSTKPMVPTTSKVRACAREVLPCLMFLQLFKQRDLVRTKGQQIPKVSYKSKISRYSLLMRNQVHHPHHARSTNAVLDLPCNATLWRKSNIKFSHCKPS